MHTYVSGRREGRGGGQWPKKSPQALYMLCRAHNLKLAQNNWFVSSSNLANPMGHTHRCCKAVG